MSRYCRLGLTTPERVVLLAALLALLPLACSRPAGLRPDEAVSSGKGQAPFQESSSAGDPKAATADEQVQDKEQRAEADLPFREAVNLPAGTLLTVRLNNAIIGENPNSNGSFLAIIDEPVQVKGSTVLLRGASVAGRVESARTSEIKRNRGYLRLTLDAIHLDGREVPVQTASLFVHGSFPTQGSELKGSPIGLERGHRLTFRLTEPVALSSGAAPTH